MTITSTQIISDPIANFPTATVACFDPTSGNLPRRSLHGPANLRFLEYLAKIGVPAVLIGSSTGQGHLRTVQELEQWFRSSAEAKLDDTVRVALLRPEDGLQANRHLLGVLKELGYPIVFIRPGTDLPGRASDAEVVENMQPIVEQAARFRFAVGVYSIPDVSGVRLTPTAVAELLNGQGGECIVAVKVTEPNYETCTLQFLRHDALKRLKIVQGWDPHLVRALQDGPKFDEEGRQRCGVTSGPMSMAVYQYQHIFEAAAHEDWREVAAAQQAVTLLFEAMQDDPAHFADLQRAKYTMGLGHPLLTIITEAQVERLLKALASVPREQDRSRLAHSMDLMGNGPFHNRLRQFI